MGTPDSFPGAFSVEVTQPYATSDLAPRVLVTLRNTAEETVMFGSGNYVPFSGFVSVEGSPEAFLYPDRYRNDGGCVFAAGKGLPSADIYAQAELGPEETASELYGVWHAEPEADGCLPAGEYAFRSDDYGVDRFENGTPAGEPPEEWGFTLQFEQT